jgi:hypothetical protein
MSHTQSGIRTHEANATDLKSVPFDHSGICVVTMLGRQTVRSINMVQFFFSGSDFFHTLTTEHLYTSDTTYYYVT